MRSAQQDTAMIHQLKKEIDTLENLNHDGIVKVIDWGEDQIHKIWYIVMELIEGESLATYLLKNAPIKADEGLRLLEALAQILVVCQENGIVHRDIKPANIMLKDGLKPILIDFGIARQIEMNHQYTNSMMLTEAYAAPEQKVGDFSHQSDLYALGRTMIECFLPKNIQLISLANPSRYVPQSIWQLIEHLLDEKEYRGDAQGLLRKLQVSAHVIKSFEQIKEAEPKDQSLKMANVQSHWVNGVMFNMIDCPEGEFWMGSDDDQYEDERPRHKVRMKQRFWMGETQVTQALWQAVMGWNASKFQESRQRPAESVTWYDCLLFCNQLSELEGFTPCFTFKEIKKDGNHIENAVVEWLRNANGYRLATEAEWEYCAKAGTNLIYSGSNHIHEVAWYDHNAKVNGNAMTHEVKTKKANAWGLYDMSGNVWEWCMDEWRSNLYEHRSNENVENPISWRNDSSSRIVRGGSYGLNADGCRVTLRSRCVADYRFNHLGLRLLRSADRFHFA